MEVWSESEVSLDSWCSGDGPVRHVQEEELPSQKPHAAPRQWGWTSAVWRGGWGRGGAVGLARRRQDARTAGWTTWWRWDGSVRTDGGVFKETGSWDVTPAGSLWRHPTNGSVGRLQPMVCNKWTSDMTRHPPVTPVPKLSSDSSLHVVTPAQPTPRSNTRHLQPLRLSLLPANVDLM